MTATTAFAPVASAERGGDDHDHELPPTSTTPGAVGIGDGLAFLGAVITTPGQPPREMNAYQAAVFVQSWVSEALFGSPDRTPPPAELPVSRVEVTGDWAAAGTGQITVYYASDGTKAWIAYPEGQLPATAPTTPPPPGNWFVAPSRAIAAFNGEGELGETLGVFNATSTPTTAGDERGAGDSGSELSPIWVVVVLAALLAGGLGWAVARSRRRAPA
jgi:hypothetical protein